MLKGRSKVITLLYEQVLALSVLLSILLSAARIASAHGGEDHGDEKKAPVTALGQTNSQLATSGNIEVFVKYPTPKFGEETVLRVFVNDRVTNAPIPGVNIALNFKSSNKTQTASAIQTNASPSDTPGVYQAAITFPDRGEYNLSLKLSSESINEQVTITGITVPDKASITVNTETINSTGMLFTVLIIVTLAALGVWFLWLRPRRVPQASTEARENIV